MKSFTVHAKGVEILADQTTPVRLFRNIRDRFPHSVLLESNDYHGKADATSIIAFKPFVTFTAQRAEVEVIGHGGYFFKKKVSSPREILPLFKEFVSSVRLERDQVTKNLPIGCVGHTSYDSVQIFEEIDFRVREETRPKIPYLRYSFFEYMIVIDHFRSRMALIHNSFPGCEGSLDEIEQLNAIPGAPEYGFEVTGDEMQCSSDESHASNILRCKKHIARGDVFQIVPSRRFARRFSGDDFELYRTLRSINPSPYLFYLDCGDYRLFGSSPEAQLLIKNGIAEISPIAGTYRRSGDAETDNSLAQKLLADEKENAEHVMLVDLARNDLNRHCNKVHVETFREIQFYSHVIHLVSRVVGELRADVHPIDIFADTFPAGTLTGAPKYKAMSLIDEFETVSRSMYGGAVGIFSSDDSSTIHAIFIRSFMSQHGTLYYQAGSGVVSDSEVESEMMEVHNKLGALTAAMTKRSRSPQ